jgi:hypothetical protein
VAVWTFTLSAVYLPQHSGFVRSAGNVSGTVTKVDGSPVTVMQGGSVVPRVTTDAEGAVQFTIDRANLTGAPEVLVDFGIGSMHVKADEYGEYLASISTGTNDSSMAAVVSDPASSTRTQLDAHLDARAAAPKLHYLDSYTRFFRDPSYIWQSGQGNTATTASATAAAGATTLNVTSVTGLSAGVVIVTGAGTAQMQQRRIASVAGSTLTLDAALTYSVASGATVSPLWTNDRHLTHEGYVAFGYFIANAKDNAGQYVIQGTTPKVTYLGNSWVDQDGPAYSTTLLARIPGAVFVDAGVSGDESDLLLARFDTAVPADSDYVVVNEPGVNDVASHYSLATMAANLEALWRKAQAIGATLIYTGLVPLQPYPAEASARAADMTDLIGTGADFPKVTGSGLPGIVGNAPLITKPNSTSVGIGTNALGAYPTGAALIAIGYNAGMAVSTGTTNTLIGYVAGAALTTESNNVAVGSSALLHATASNTTAVGTNALTALTTGAANVAVGYNAGLALTTGGLNTVVGYAALSACATGSSNTAVGELALSNATSAYNCALGQGALQSQTSGLGNIAIGYLAGYNVAGSTAKATTTQINQVVIGRQAGGQGSSNVAIGYYAEAAGDNSVAIGANAVAPAANDFVLGTANHRYKMPGLPTVAPAAGSGVLWNNAGVVSVA